MAQMRAAVVTAFGEPPVYETFTLPEPPTGAEVVDVVAAGLHPRVRSAADGTHYTSTGRLPLVPGIDGVARRADGRLVYFVADDDAPGTMAERALLDPRRSVELPPGTDPVRIAAAMNPAMSSWVALRRRVPLQPGQSVLVLGATGNAGAMAVRVARLLGAGRVVAAGRDAGRLAALEEADATVQLTGDAGPALAEAAAEVDVVLDYLWAEPALRAMVALLTGRADRSRALDWVQIGSVAGPDLALPSAALRSANLRLLGNGQGAVSARAYVAELPALLAEIESGRLEVAARAVPLADVTKAWTEPSAERVVLVP